MEGGSLTYILCVCVCVKEGKLLLMCAYHIVEESDFAFVMHVTIFCMHKFGTHVKRCQLQPLAICN